MGTPSTNNTTFLTRLKQRLPANYEMILVFSMAAFCIFSWELRNYFYQFPALVLSYPIWDILSIAAYVLSFALIESLIVTAFIVLLAFPFPSGVLRDDFGYKGSFLILAGALISIHLQMVMSNQPTPRFLLIELARLLGLWLVPVLLTRYVPFIRKIVLDVLDRLTIFSFVYVPLGIISLLIVIIRNLW